jgi:anti-anti-sigma factor
MQLTINSREVQNVIVLDLGGRVVAGEECDTLRSKIKSLLADNRKRILLNLAEVSRMDSTGIGMLVESVIITVKEQGQFKLVNLPRLLYNVLSTHRLLQAFEIYKTEDEALASFAK